MGTFRVCYCVIRVKYSILRTIVYKSLRNSTCTYELKTTHIVVINYFLSQVQMEIHFYYMRILNTTLNLPSILLITHALLIYLLSQWDHACAKYEFPDTVF